MRNLEINSSRFPLPVQLDALCAIDSCMRELNQEFFVIGATARDVLSMALGVDSSSRTTSDLDISLAIASWDDFQHITSKLLACGFTKDPVRKQRFYYRGGEIDVVPFGGVSPDGERIYWPPEEDPMMTVRGFDSVLRECVTVTVTDRAVRFKVPTLAGLFMLKLDAWMDRGRENNKDMTDMMYIWDNYFLPHCSEPRYAEMYDVVAEGSPFTYAAYMVAKDARELLTVEEVASYSHFIDDELAKDEVSFLLEESSRISRQNFATVRTAWQVFSNCLKNHEA